MTIQNGHPINPSEIESLIKDLYTLIRGKLGKLIPLGSNILYSFSNPGTKTFKFRPNSIPTLYDTRTNKTVQSSQTLRQIPGLGSPWTATLGTTLGAIQLFNPQVSASYPGVFSLDGQSTTYYKEDIFPLNPPTDLVYNNQPFKGNSPFINNGFLGFSSFVQDSNIQIYPSEDGTSLRITAQRLSLLCRPQTTSSFTVSTDAAQKVNSSRNAIEQINLNNVDLSVAVLDDFNGTTTSGHFPAKSGVISAGDYGVWVVYNLVTATQLIVITPWPTSGYSKVSGIVTGPHSTFLSSYSNFIYSRCIGCVRINSNTKFEVSNVQIWGEPASTLNANHLYGELYQQCSSTDTVSILQTNSTDRRIVPAYYYMDVNNPTIQGLVTYSGITKHIPGAGGNQVECWFEGYNPVTKTVQGSIKINSLEVTDGTSSIWLSGITINSIEIPDTAFASSNTWVWEADTNLGFSTSSNGVFIWIVVDPSSILDTVSGVSIPNNNLKLKILLSASHSWAGVGASWKAANIKYTFRSRIAWIPTHLPVPNTLNARPVYVRDGEHTVLYKFGGAGSSVGNLNESNSNTELLNITANTPNWTDLSIRNSLPKDSAAGNSTGCVATRATIKLRHVENSGASPSSTNRELFIGTTSSGAVLSAAATQANSTAHLLLLGTGSTIVAGQMSVTIPISSTDSFFYAGILPVTGAGLTNSGAIVSGYFLPYSY